MKLLLYRGRSIISLGIRVQTRSKYSHAALLMDDGTAYEAWHVGGVRRLMSPFDGHSAATRIDVYELPAHNEEAARAFLRSQVGKRYDFRNVFRFLTRVSARDNDKWFCSELALTACAHAGLNLLNMEPSECAPAHLAISPVPEYLHQLRLEDGVMVTE